MCVTWMVQRTIQRMVDMTWCMERVQTLFHTSNILVLDGYTYICIQFMLFNRNTRKYALWSEGSKFFGILCHLFFHPNHQSILLHTEYQSHNKENIQLINKYTAERKTDWVCSATHTFRYLWIDLQSIKSLELI